MVYLFLIKNFYLYVYIYSILLFITHTVTYTSKRLSIINFNKMTTFTFTANLPHKLAVFFFETETCSFYHINLQFLPRTFYCKLR